MEEPEAELDGNLLCSGAAGKRLMPRDFDMEAGHCPHSCTLHLGVTGPAWVQLYNLVNEQSVLQQGRRVPS
jgi:hypothetical protein